MSSPRPHRRRVAVGRCREQRGMLLLEMLVAVVLLSVGLLGLVGLQSSVVANSINAEDRTTAALLANELVSTMWAKGTTSIPSSDYQAWQTKVSTTMAGVSGSGTAAADVNNAGVTLIKITWLAHSKKATDAQSSYITQVVLQ